MIFNMLSGSSGSQTETFFLRIGGASQLKDGKFNINGMFITEPNYAVGTGDIGDAYEIPVLSIPNTYEGNTYNVCIIMSSDYMFSMGSEIPDVEYYIYSVLARVYYFNAVPGQTYKFSITKD